MISNTDMEKEAVLFQKDKQPCPEKHWVSGAKRNLSQVSLKKAAWGACASFN